MITKLYSIEQYVHVESLKRLPGVQISLSFSLGKYSSITVKGGNNKLVLEDRVRCKRFCTFLVYPNANLKINSGVFFNNYCSVTCLGNIEIGKGTLFGEGVKLYDHNHKHDMIEGKLKIDPNDYKIGFIKIGENCWIGSNVTILKNVEIGDNVIIGANCLIHKSVPANSIVRAVSETETVAFNN